MTLTGFKARNHPQQQAKDHVDDMGTPWEVFNQWQQRFHFTIDVAAAPHNAKLPRYHSIADDGLAQSWTGERVWCNPPYSNIRPWIEKAWDEWDHTGLPMGCIVMLLPANRTEQGWWQDLVEHVLHQRRADFRAEFLRGRMRFDRPTAVIGPKGDRPPFGNVLLIWGNE